MDVHVSQTGDDKCPEAFRDNRDSQVGCYKTEDGRELDGFLGQLEVDIGSVKQRSYVVKEP